MHALGETHRARKELEHAVGWYTKAAEAGLPKPMFCLGWLLDAGEGVAAPDYPAAADWYRHAGEAGHGEGASNLCSNNECTLSAAVGLADFACHIIRNKLIPHCLSQVASYELTSINCQALRCGVTRSKRRAVQWLRKAAKNGNADACKHLAQHLYLDLPYAREVGHVG
jgi:TPR repeat protein